MKTAERNHPVRSPHERRSGQTVGKRQKTGALHDAVAWPRDPIRRVSVLDCASPLSPLALSVVVQGLKARTRLLRNSLRAVVAGVLLWAMLPYDAPAQELPDLPFTSGSTGADGEPKFNVPFSPGRGGYQIVFDGVKNRLMLFGGSDGVVALGDTWILEGSDWQRISPSLSPSPRYYYGMCFDETRRQVVLFGGADPGGSKGDTWLWNGEIWREASPANSPPAQSAPRMAYDAAREQVVLYGNSRTFTWDGADWTERNVSPPGIGREAGFAYDGERREVVAFGGDFSSSPMWTWDGSTWTQRTPAELPPNLIDGIMVYDSARKEVVLWSGWERSGNIYHHDTWLWNGTGWRLASPKYFPSRRAGAAAAFDPVQQRVIVAGGAGPDRFNDTWAWNGTDWIAVNGVATFDVSTKPDGVWNFTKVTVPKDVAVQFINNPGNLPVRWLATESIQIDGRIDVSGQAGDWGSNPALPAPGGPGGFAGGLGGVPESLGGPVAGTSGQGPGGGEPLAGERDQAKLSGKYALVYGNPYVQPLVGGSGGAGAYANGGLRGSRGGGGGGAILISSSRDIVIGTSGLISANGGTHENLNRDPAGSGSGGGIRLQADRIAITGNVAANPDGRVRVESYEREVRPGSLSVGGSLSFSAPVPTQSFDTTAALLNIVSVAGQNVALPPKGDLRNPDVIFSSAGEVVVTVQADTLPNGTPVKLRVTAPGTVINKPADGEPRVSLAGGRANFTLNVPKGVVTLQAFAELPQ